MPERHQPAEYRSAANWQALQAACPPPPSSLNCRKRSRAPDGKLARGAGRMPAGHDWRIGMTKDKEKRPAHFVVVGGGTAGWIAAFILVDSARRRNLDIEVSVVESSKLPTVGVGEATTAAFRV